jgi:3-oxoacyl-(acyl-carrier-protein) synthase
VHAEQVCVVRTGVVVPGCADSEDLWRRAQDGPLEFGLPDRSLGHDTDPGGTGRTYDLRFGAVPSTSPDLQVTWLRRALQQCLPAGPVRAGRTGLFLAASTDTSHEIDVAVTADVIAAGTAAHLTAGPDDDTRAMIRKQLAGADPSAAMPHEEFLPYRQAERAIAGILPEDTAILVVDNICPSSLYAVDLGARHLLDGSVDLAYCGGVSSHGPLRQFYFAEMGTLSPSGNLRAFDEAADGTLFSEGAAVVVLKRLDDALRDHDTVLAVLAGFGAATDGRNKAIFAPSQEGQTRAMVRAREVNDLPGSAVSWVVGHGTATTAGDHTELRSIAAAHPGATPWVTGNKPMLGHTGMACGVVSLIQAVMGLSRSTIPRQPNHTALPDHARSLPVRVPAEAVAWTPSAARSPFAGVFACGLGGINGYQLLAAPGPAAYGVRSAPPSRCEEVVLVRWTALLPGRPDDATVALRLARGESPGDQPRFETPYPVPPFSTSQISPRVAAQLDMSQLLAVELAGRLGHREPDSAPIWAGVRERTGIFGAHHGLTRSAVESAVGCLGPGMATTLDGTDAHQAAADFLREHRARSRPLGPYSLVGRMASTALGWVANRRDFHGLTMMVDAGPASGLAALHTASCYLRRGDLDLAMVLAWSAGPPELTARSLGLPPEEVAEGAFGVALARADTARERGWPVLARLRTSPHDRAAARPSGTPSYAAADGLVQTIRTVLGG